VTENISALLPNLSGVPAKTTSVPQQKVARIKHRNIIFINTKLGKEDGIMSSPFSELQKRQNSNQ
jgi:hypothetical protein